MTNQITQIFSSMKTVIRQSKVWSIRVRKFLYSIAKTEFGGMLLHWIFAYFSAAVPGEKLADTDSLLAFPHPSPSYPLHILIVPKEKFSSLKDLPSDEGTFEADLFSTVNDLVEKFSLEEGGYRLIVNGGSAQEVNHLHFHLISEDYEKSSRLDT
jgi:histidine triad (HIT) family protein